jgi:Zn-dependent protease
MPDEQPAPSAKERLQRAGGAVVAAVAAVAKLGALVFKVKFVGLALSMLVSVLGYTLFFGWTFAVGLVLLVLVHELGHLVVMRARGYTTGLPVFVPMFGAYVKGSKEGATAYDSALGSLAGPLAGGLGALAVLGLGDVYSSDFLNALGYFALFINLLNLAPIAPFDGHQPGSALRVAEWVALLAVLGLVEWQTPGPAVPLLVLTGAFRAYQTWKHPAPTGLAPAERRTVVLTYVGIIAMSLVAMHGHQPVARHL